MVCKLPEVMLPPQKAQEWHSCGQSRNKEDPEDVVETPESAGTGSVPSEFVGYVNQYILLLLQSVRVEFLLQSTTLSFQTSA